MTTTQNTSATGTTPPKSRVDGLVWPTLTDEVNAYGCTQTAALLTRAECQSISDLHDEVEHFRSTIDMARYRFGSGQVELDRGNLSTQCRHDRPRPIRK